MNLDGAELTARAPGGDLDVGRHPNAELVACSGALSIPPPPMDNKGELVKVTVDFSAELVGGIYRNLEFTNLRSLWQELLEEPWVRGTSATSVVDSDLSSRTYAPRYNRYWFRYYLMLKAFEQHLLDGFARVLDLDPTQAGITSRSLFAKPEAPKDGMIVIAAQKAAATFRANLLPGETVTVTAGGKTTVIEADPFLDDIPFAVDAEG